MGIFHRLWGNQRGGVAVYAAFFSMLAMSAGSISIDLGRLVTLKSQLQHRADAGATAAAVYLDGSTGSRTRATDVAENSSNDSSNIGSTSETLTVSSVNFYSSFDPKVAATGDDDANIVEVIMTPQLVNFFFTPFLSMMVDQFTQHSKSITASAMAQSNPLMCAAPPLMTCDPTETAGIDIMDPDNAGVQMLLKAGQGNGPFVPGNFGLLETGYGPGANNVEQALADVEPPGCVDDEVTTEPGNMARKVELGVNARFNGSSFPWRAPNVQNYPRDSVFETSSSSGDGNSGSSSADSDAYYGDADWDSEDYWRDNHDSDYLPSDLDDASRYQVYLYEIGETFDRDGMKTIYPVDASAPSGYTRITPPSTELPTDGHPDGSVASNGALRRVVTVAVLQCVADSVQGRGTYSTYGKYVEAFVTEEAGAPPNSQIYGELLGPVTILQDDNFHANVSIVE
jgi:Flp pilus assembly protein TadG